jgi:hypothetical protein
MVEANTFYEKGGYMLPQVFVTVDSPGITFELAEGSLLRVLDPNQDPIYVRASNAYAIGSTNLTLNYFGHNCIVGGLPEIYQNTA